MNEDGQRSERSPKQEYSEYTTNGNDQQNERSPKKQQTQSEIEKIGTNTKPHLKPLSHTRNHSTPLSDLDLQTFFSDQNHNQDNVRNMMSHTTSSGSANATSKNCNNPSEATPNKPITASSYRNRHQYEPPPTLVSPKSLFKAKRLSLLRETSNLEANDRIKNQSEITATGGAKEALNTMDSFLNDIDSIISGTKESPLPPEKVVPRHRRSQTKHVYRNSHRRCASAPRTDFVFEDLFKNGENFILTNNNDSKVAAAAVVSLQQSMSPPVASSNAMTATPPLLSTQLSSATNSILLTPEAKQLHAIPVFARKSSPKTNSTGKKAVMDMLPMQFSEVPPGVQDTIDDSMLDVISQGHIFFQKPEMDTSAEHEKGEFCRLGSANCSENDPSPYQLEIPPANELLMHAQICHFGEQYKTTFTPPTPQKKTSTKHSASATQLRLSKPPSMAMLVNVPNPQLHHAIHAEKHRQQQHTHNFTNWNQSIVAEAASNVPTHMIQALLDCADDIVLEGYFPTASSEPNTTSNTNTNPNHLEVLVFNSQKHRQFIVCFVGCAKHHASKPIEPYTTTAATKLLFSSFLAKMGKSKKDINVNSHKGTPIPLHASFENAYLQHILNINHKHQKSSTDKTPDAGSTVVTMNTTIEHKLFSLLKYLQLRYPFCDVAFTGYSYGAALSTLCAVRYASRHPTMRCTCHVFGSPKLGGDDFKRYAHKFGNLRIVRCETLGDEWVHCPDGGTLSDNVNGKGDVLWGHVGHGIILNPSGCGKVEYGTNSTPRSKKDVQPNIHNDLSSTLHEAVSFYKYDRHHPVKKEMLMLQQHTISAPVNHHDIKSYIFSIQQITAFKMPWFESFVGGGEIVGEVSSVNDPVPAQTNRATVSKTAIGDIDSDIVGTSVSYAGANIRPSPNHGGKKSARTLKQKQVRHILV